MKQIKAFVHRTRVRDLVHALEAAGFRHLSLFDVKGLLRALDAREQQYSVELGESIIHEVQMEVFCEDQDVDKAIAIFRTKGRTGKPEAGCLYVSAIERSLAIE